MSTAALGMPDPGKDRKGFAVWQELWRGKLRGMLGISLNRVPLASESRGQFVHNGLVIEKWIFTSERGSRIPAVLYRPETPVESQMPALVMTYGHGGSKSQPDYQYPSQVFAKLGIACLAMDPIGEEERHVTGGMGTRAHDPEPVHNQSRAAGRLIMGKLVWDTMRGVDFLLERADIDPRRLGVSGNSLGGATAGWMAVLDSRLRFTIVSGWAFAAATETWGKFCTLVPNRLMRDSGLTWDQYLSLAAPHCAMRIVNGDADIIIDQDGSGRAWRDTDRAVAAAANVYAALGSPGGIQTWYEPGGGHRPYPVRKPNLEWLIQQVGPAGWTADKVRALPETNFGQWCRDHEFEIEPLYGIPLHLLGATVTDLNVIPLKREQLAVLRPEEIGIPELTIEGWLSQVVH